MAPDVLELSGVGKRFGRGRWVLRGVDAGVAAGEIVRISGANGAGKSTLLRLAVGACRPSTGTVRAPRGRTRYVPDRTVSCPRLSAAGYLTHMGAIQGLSRGAAQSRGSALMELLGLAADADVQIGLLSKGTARKVLIAQALLTPPGLLVLDEPWSGLDDRAQGVLVRILDDVAAEGAAVLFTEHRESIVPVHVTSAYRVVDGRLERDDPGATAVPAPRFVPGAGGDMHVELTAGTSQPDWAALPGVQSVTVTGSGVLLRVCAGRVEAVLAHALDESWSVTAVRRAD